MNNWFTADTHFGHRRIIDYCHRPFANVTEMDEELILNWNKIVNKDDTIYHLGDFAFGCSLEYALSIIKRLNGHKRLIVGNHDKLALEMNNIRPGSWESIEKMDEIIVHNQKMVLCHYPIASGHWHHAYKSSWMLYGHVHGTFKNEGKSLDVGVDCWNYTPISFWDLKKEMDKRPITELVHNKR